MEGIRLSGNAGVPAYILARVAAGLGARRSTAPERGAKLVSHYGLSSRPGAYTLEVSSRDKFGNSGTALVGTFHLPQGPKLATDEHR